MMTEQHSDTTNVATAPTDELADLDRLARLMDSRFKVPLLPIRLGLDTIVGLVPGLGDAVTVVPAGYIIARGVRLGARKRTVARMALNAGLDTIVGAVPVLGDLFDLVFKGNLRNIALLRQDLARQSVERRIAA